MTCKICKEIVTPPDAAIQALHVLTQHIAQHHPEQLIELQHQASAVMMWLTARIFTLDGPIAKAHEDMTARMVKLSQSIQAELDQTKADQQRQVIAAHFDQLEEPSHTPGRPKRHK